jgi:hypothetical protein
MLVVLIRGLAGSMVRWVWFMDAFVAIALCVFAAEWFEVRKWRLDRLGKWGSIGGVPTRWGC